MGKNTAKLTVEDGRDVVGFLSSLVLLEDVVIAWRLVFLGTEERTARGSCSCGR